MTFKRMEMVSKEAIPWEKTNVFRVTQEDTFTVLVDDNEIVTFNFKKAKFEEVEGA